MIISSLIFLQLALQAYAGRANAIMACIQPYNLLLFKGYAWSKEALEVCQDFNKDGKISLREHLTPTNKWHDYKRKMVLAIALCGVIYVPLTYYLTLKYHLILNPFYLTLYFLGFGFLNWVTFFSCYYLYFTKFFRKYQKVK